MILDLCHLREPKVQQHEPYQCAAFTWFATEYHLPISPTTFSIHASYHCKISIFTSIRFPHIAVPLQAFL